MAEEGDWRQGAQLGGHLLLSPREHTVASVRWPREESKDPQDVHEDDWSRAHRGVGRVDPGLWG